MDRASLLLSGPSRVEFKPDDSLMVGVNDHWKYYEFNPHFVVFMDYSMGEFIYGNCPSHRLAPKYYGTNIKDLSSRAECELVCFDPHRGEYKMGRYPTDIYNWQYTAPMALQIINGLDPKEINIYGLDLVHDGAPPRYKRQWKMLNKFWPLFMDSYRGDVVIHTHYYEAPKHGRIHQSDRIQCD